MSRISAQRLPIVSPRLPIRLSEPRAFTAKRVETAHGVPSIAIDFTTLDRISPTAGQYRYVVDLIRGLVDLDPPALFVLLGSQPFPPAELGDLFGARSTKWRYVQLVPSIGRGAFYCDQLRYTAALISQRIDLLHSVHSFVPLISPFPVAVTVYDLMVELFQEYRAIATSRARRRFRRGVRFKASRLICISETTASDVQRLWNVAPSEIDVVLLGSAMVLNSDNGAERRDGDEDGSFAITSPYNLEPRKNLISLLHAFAGVREGYPRLRLILFGRAAVTPEREAAFEKTIAELGIAEAVVRTGVLPDPELRRLYRRSTLFVFPSLYEGFGLPVLEAMSCGACVVSRNASAMAEIVGDAGVLVETADATQLAASMAQLLGNPGMRSQLGVEARNRAKDFTIRRMAEGTFNAYLKALSGKH